MGLDAQSREEPANGFAGRLDVIEGPNGRRSWPDSLKAQIVRESLQPGITVSEVARRHRMSPQHLTLWRRAAREGRLTLSPDPDDNGGGFVPLAIDACRSEAVPCSDERISIEVNGVVLKLPAETAAARIAEIILALEVRR